MNILLIISNIVLLAIILFFFKEFFNIIFRGYAPFISTRPRVLRKIFNEINLNKDFCGQVYELGCGRAGFLKTFGRHYPKAELVGVEYSLWPWLITKIQQSLQKDARIKIIKKNFYKVNLTEADIIYCFLNVDTMKKLKDKFRQECRTGTIIISYAFSLPDIKPDKVIKLENKSKIFFYHWQNERAQ